MADWFPRRRSAPSGPLVLLSRPGCHLCDELLARVRRAAPDGTVVEIVDVDSDESLSVRFGNQIPVLLDAGGNVLAKAKDEEWRIRARLRWRV